MSCKLSPVETICIACQILFTGKYKKTISICRLLGILPDTLCANELICVFVLSFLRPSQPNEVMSSAVSLPNHMFTGQAQSSKWLTSIVHILSPETDNCPS